MKRSHFIPSTRYRTPPPARTPLAALELPGEAAEALWVS
jgi:hypothetical protein